MQTVIYYRELRRCHQGYMWRLARQLPYSGTQFIRTIPRSPATRVSSRSFFNFWGVNRRLKSLEGRANKMLKDPVMQATFYRDLLKAGRGDVVIERFKTPGVAQNDDCKAMYARALRETGTTDDAFVASNPQLASGDSMLGQGSETRPIHVVVSRSKGWALFWALFFAGNVVFIFYFGSRLVSMVREVGPDLGAKADKIKVETSDVRFSDVLGADEAREELEEIVEFLRDPARFTGLGGKLPKGVLLTGPPGTGKTLLARAVAGEAGVPFYFMSGSEFDEIYVGVGAKRLRELFDSARKNAPAIVFIDELDAIGGKRDTKDQAYARQTLNQLLVELDGFHQNSNVIFIAATNFPEMLDKALTRPGRFDKRVNVDLPDVRGRSAILKHHMKKVEVGPDVNVMNLARGTPGFSGADLMNLVNQAAIYASQKRAFRVDMSHFEWAKDKILLGAERRTMVMTEETRRNTAFHEAGHAIMALYTPGATPLYKATILPRGSALGVTFQLPELDKYDQTKRELLARLDVCMGGRIAEELIHGPENVTSGCSSDLKNATGVAKAMVTSFGMSDKIGPVDLSQDWSGWSSQTRNLAEQEIRDLLLQSEDRTRSMLKNKSTELERLAMGLLEFETLDKEEIENVVKGARITRDPKCTNTVVKSDDIRDKRRVGALAADAAT